jgi:hypothetical protein
MTLSIRFSPSQFHLRPQALAQTRSLWHAIATCKRDML